MFLDRDGVIIENVATYVRSWQDVSILPGALTALARLKESIFKVVIVTNQSAVGRGVISFADAQSINGRLLDVIRQAGGRVDGIYMCVHAPSQDCECRKPKPGLMIQAASELSLDLHRSFLIGDALSDLQAGHNAGIPVNMLVRTGRGEQQSLLPEARTLPPFWIYDHLENAVTDLLTRSTS